MYLAICKRTNVFSLSIVLVIFFLFAPGQDQYQASCTIAEGSGEPSQKIKGDVTFTQAVSTGTYDIIRHGFITSKTSVLNLCWIKHS